MSTVRFKKLSLLSSVEKTAMTISFTRKTTILQGGNGLGKSALIKSLYDALGATPHKIDTKWKNADVASLLEFEIGEQKFSSFKFSGIYSIYNSQGDRLIQTKSIAALSNLIASLFDFKLLMVNRKSEIVVPPPAYAFAPFYVDQDEGWRSAWKNFTKMYLPNSKIPLAEYHTGLKPNQYYIAKASRDETKGRIRAEEIKREGMTAALNEVRSLNESVGLYFDLDDFINETEALMKESNRLYAEQSSYRNDLAQLVEEKSLWESQISITKMAIAEGDAAMAASVDLPEEVECPTCGQDHSNDISTRFGIAADSASLIGVLNDANAKRDKLQEKISVTKDGLDEIAVSLQRISGILDFRENKISLREVIDIQGRNAAVRALRQQVEELDIKITGLNDSVKSFEKDMRDTQDKERTKTIREFFDKSFVSNSIKLDTPSGEAKERKITSAVSSRGSKGPRALVAYYYAILSTARLYGSSAFCPIVVDAPNQQGQDSEHLPAIIEFLVSSKPEGTQLILALEDALDLVDSEEDSISIVSLKSKKDQLLLPEYYESVSMEMSGFFEDMLI